MTKNIVVLKQGIHYFHINTMYGLKKYIDGKAQYKYSNLRMF